MNEKRTPSHAATLLLAGFVAWSGLASGCASQEATAIGGPPAWGDINDFVYQLQGVDLTALGETAFDLVVMDYSSDGTAAGRFTEPDIQALQDSPGGAKRVLAYMSIGEAETYRWYWQDGWDADGDGQPDAAAPAWLGPENPEWAGNYKVRFWLPEWQDIILSYLDDIAASGFDGVYLDIIDAYEYWGPDGDSGLARASAADDMVAFVEKIASHARQTLQRPDFGIFPQNGEPLTASDEYVATITGIGKEDLWYLDNDRQPANYTEEASGYLDRVAAAGKPVLVIEYPNRPDLIDDVYDRADEKGHIPYVTTRELDTLTISPGHEPD